jgi:hypothetical protein
MKTGVTVASRSGTARRGAGDSMGIVVCTPTTMAGSKHVARIATASIGIALTACGGTSIVEVEQSPSVDASTFSLVAAVPIPTASCTDASPCAASIQCFDRVLAPPGMVPACHVLAVGATACVSPMITPSADVIAQTGLGGTAQTVCEIPPVREGASCVTGVTEDGGWCYEPETREGLCASFGSGASAITFEPLALSDAVVLVECDLGP